jgi:hypothetical protein
VRGHKTPSALLQEPRRMNSYDWHHIDTHGLETLESRLPANRHVRSSEGGRRKSADPRGSVTRRRLTLLPTAHVGCLFLPELHPLGPAETNEPAHSLFLPELLLLGRQKQTRVVTAAIWARLCLNTSVVEAPQTAGGPQGNEPLAARLPCTEPLCTESPIQALRAHTDAQRA